jgi:predicted acyl esterase
LQLGEAVELDVEIWPTSIVVPPGYQLALWISGKDYEVDGTDIALPNAPYPMKGVGPFLHIDPEDRPPSLSATQNTLHFSKDRRPYLLLPIIPER